MRHYYNHAINATLIGYCLVFIAIGLNVEDHNPGGVMLAVATMVCSYFAESVRATTGDSGVISGLQLSGILLLAISYAIWFAGA